MQGGSRPRTRSQPKKPPGPSRGVSGQPGPELPFWGGGSSHPWSSATAHCAPPPPSPARPLLRSMAGACGGQTRRLQRATTLTSERGAAGKRLPPPLPGHPQAGALPGFTGTGLTAPSRGLPSSSRASPGRRGVRAHWGSHVLAAVTSQPLDAPGNPSIPLPRYDGAAGWELGASSCFFPPVTLPQVPILAPAPTGTLGIPPGTSSARMLLRLLPPHPQHPAWSCT